MKPHLIPSKLSCDSQHILIKSLSSKQNSISENRPLLSMYTLYTRLVVVCCQSLQSSMLWSVT